MHPDMMAQSIEDHDETEKVCAEVFAETKIDRKAASDSEAPEDCPTPREMRLNSKGQKAWFVEEPSDPDDGVCRSLSHECCLVEDPCHVHREESTTITVQIGNSDDKLTQQSWSRYVEAVRNAMQSRAQQAHFEGGAAVDAPWQNFCWVSQITWRNVFLLEQALERIRDRYKQDSVAVCYGDVRFI